MSSEEKFMLPADHYGIQLETEQDVIKLRYLLSEIGEAKVRSTAAKYTASMKGTKPYLSKIWTAYRIKVPVHLYRAVKVPIYGVYVLVRSDMSAIKISVSKDLLQRAISMLKVASIRDAGGLFQYFEPNESCVFLVGAREDAIAIEGQLLELTKNSICTQDSGVSWGAGGRKEWRKIDVLPIVLAELQEMCKSGNKITLLETFLHSQAMSGDNDMVPGSRFSYVKSSKLF